MRRTRLSALLSAPLLASCTLLLPFPPPETESTEAGTCRDGIDNDFDGETDWEDPDCVLDETDAPMCADGRDNDADGRTDYEDPGCWPYARVVVERCARVEGVDLRPFEGPGDFWAGAGTLVDRGDGSFELEPDASGERALILIPPITGAARSLRVELAITLTDEVFEWPGVPILTVVRARDVGSDVRPDPSTVQELVVTTGNGLRLVGFRNRTSGPGTSTYVGPPETGDAELTLFVTDTGAPRLEVETATEETAAHTSSEPVPWSSIDSLRLLWSPPPGVRVRRLRVHTDPAETCAMPPDLLAPPYSEPRALAHGHGTCLVLADPTAESWATTQLARSPTEGATWERVTADPEVTGLRSCSGITWDDALDVFRVACTPPVGGGLVFGESPDCGRTWRRVGVRHEETLVSRALGYTMLGEQHELWWGSQDGVVRRWTDDATLSAALVEDEREMLLREDGTPLVADGVRVSIARVGRDRLFVRSDGVAVSLVVATAVAAEPANVRTVIDPLLSPSGIAGTFDSGLLSFASATPVPPHGEEAARLLVVYAGSTHCADGVCGQHASTARVSILPP